MTKRQKDIQQHFDRLSTSIDGWRRRNRLYHHEQTRYLRYLVTENKRILELGCGNGDLLNALKPSYGLGVDISTKMVELAEKKHPHLTFVRGNAARLDDVPGEIFDYIILSDLAGYLDDIQACLDGLHRFCGSHTRIIISSYNFLWEPVLRLAELLRLKMPTPEHSWLTLDDMRNLLSLADYQVVKTERRLLVPVYLPIVSRFLNWMGTLPYINNACLCNYIVARPVPGHVSDDLTVSIVIPCRNEKGNIEETLRRLPHFGASQEIIFVDGHSTDGTPEEIHRLAPFFAGRDIRLLVQDHTGKGDAVRKGFDSASGDILIILDADLTVPPEDLPKFYRAIVSGKAEFLNGSRLVYPMENEAMRMLNLVANKFFALTFSWLLGERLKDTLCGTKALLRKDYMLLSDNRSYFGEFDPFGDFDLLFGASKMNLKIMEIPVRYSRRSYGTSQISRFRHGFLLLRMVIFALRKIKWF